MAPSRWPSASLTEFAAELAGPGPAPAGGAAAAAACAFAAALVELALDPGDPDRERAAELRDRALELVDLDIDAYGRLAAARRRDGGEGLEAARREASGPPVEIAEAAAEIDALAERAQGRGDGPRRADAAAAAELARGARAAALSLAEANQAEGS
jgi:formiminotetrahydrofolate cyclodeaminase